MGALAFARRHLRGQGARAALTAAGVACGVALVVAIRVINASTLASFTDAIEDLAGGAALQVRGPGPFPEAVEDELRAIAGIDHAVPIVTATSFGTEPPIAGEALSVFAADVTDGHAIRTLHLIKAGEHVVDDPLGFLVDPRSVIVTDVLAARLGVTAGARLPLRTPHGLETFIVRGVLPPGGVGRAFGGNLILMDVVGAQLVLGEDGLIDQVDVTLAPGVGVEDVEQRLRAALPAGREAIRPARRGEQIERYLASFQTLLSGLSSLALLAAIFVVGSAIATSVAARRRELGILRCAGAERRQVAALVLGEALATGIVGAAAGVPLGIVLARLLLRTVTESTELIFSMTVFTARLELSTSALVGGVATGVGAAVLAAWLPARNAALVSPLVAVRTAAEANPMRRWRPRGAIVTAIALTGGALWAETRFDSPWCGNVAALAADFALVLVFMRLAGRVAALFLAPAREALGFAGRLAVDRLVHIPDQLALAAAVLALGLGLMMTAATVARSFEESVLDFIRRQVHADLVVASTAATGWIEAPLDEAVGDRLAAVAGVARGERVRVAEHDYRGPRISIHSLHPDPLPAQRGAGLQLAPGASLDAVRHAIATQVGVAQGLKVLTQRELYTYHRDAVRRAFRLTDALEILPLVVAALGLAEALLAVSLDRRREFALLRAAGATRAQVARAVVGESAGVGALGLAGGLAIGLVLALLWVRVNFTYQLGWEIDFHFAAGSIPAAAAAALLVSVPAGLLPARRGARPPGLEAPRAG